MSRTYRHIAIVAGLIVIVISYPVPSQALPALYDWQQFNFDVQHSGNNVREAQITLDNVSQLHRLFQMRLQGTNLAVADGAPVYLNGVQTSSGTRNMVFVTTMAGDIIAVDAVTGQQLWQHGNPAPTACLVNGNGVPCYTTSDPAIDPNKQFVYSYGLDGYVHMYKVADGTEIVGNGWPQLATLKSINEKGSAALSVVTDRSGNRYLYVVNSGYPGDGGDYQGHLTVINLATGVQHVFNAVCAEDADVHFPLGGPTDCDTVQAAIWGRPGVIYDPDTEKIYFATGNGSFDPTKYYWGDTVLALRPDGSGTAAGVPLDSYTPANFDSLQNDDEDLGSSSPAILPTVNGHHYAVQAGKDEAVRIIDLDNLSGKNSAGNLGGELVNSYYKLPLNEPILTQPAVWTNPTDGTTWLFITAIGSMMGLPINANEDGWGTPWVVNTGGCASPIVANGVLFCAGADQIKAFNPVTGAEVWHDQIGTIHWQSPIVVNGVLYITDNSTQLSAYVVDTSS